MKKIDRLPPPDCLDNNIESSKTKKIEYYENLRDKDGKIYPRWNTICKDKDGSSKIKKQLLNMTNSCCAYCGDKVTIHNMDVDHYLPSSKFPYLAYCFDNFIPSCKYCNQSIKKDFVPPSLQDKSIVENIISDEAAYDIVYDKEHILSRLAIDDRLIEPTFDNPEEHLTFNPEFYYYESKTGIGKLTAEKFFNKHKEVAKHWESLSLFIKNLVINGNPQETVIAFINLNGYEYICLKFYEYWKSEKDAGRINR